MARPGTRRGVDERRVAQRSGGQIELRDVDTILAQVSPVHKAPGWIALDHVGVWRIVTADRETSRRRINRIRGSDRPDVLLCIRGVAQQSIRPDREDGYVSPAVVCDQGVSTR